MPRGTYQKMRGTKKARRGLQVSSTQEGKEGAVKEARKRGRVSSFKDEPAFVRYSNGATINLGNYQSARMDVAITMPCLPGDVDKVLAKIVKKVDKKVNDMAKNYAPEVDNANKLVNVERVLGGK